MKFSFILLFTGLVCLSANTGYAQQTRVSIELEEASLADVFREIENQSEYRFFYNNAAVNAITKINLNTSNQAISTLLNGLFAGTNLRYQMVENYIVITQVDDDVIAVANNIVFQGITITGTVTDDAGEPLPGVSIAVHGTTTGTTTDADGRYSIAVPDRDAVLVFTFMGFGTQQIAVGVQNIVDVTMTEDVGQFEDLVVVGYGTQRRVNLTGSVATVQANKLENRAAPNLSTMLTGFVSGVSVRQSSGNPGSDQANIRIRGVGTFSNDYRAPLVLVDGAVADMNTVNPEDVESISIIKDAASASIYGARGANGVILVTTKKGSVNEMPRVTYTGIFTQEKASGIFEFLTDYADYMELWNMAELSNNPRAVTTYDWDEIADWRDAKRRPNEMYTNPNNGIQIPNYLAFPNTDWSRLLFAPSFSYRHNLSITGGSQNSNYLFSMGYFNNPGTLENTGINRFNIRINAESKITNFLKIGTQTFALRQIKEPGDITTVNTYRFQTIGGMVGFHDGKYGAPESSREASNVNNPLRQVNQTGGENTTTRVNTTWFAELTLFKNLIARGSINYQNYFYDSKTFSRQLDGYSFRNDVVISPGVTLGNATTSRSSTRSEQYTATATINYNVKLRDDHDISALAGYEQFYYNSSGFGARQRGLLNFDVTDITTGTEMDQISGTAETDYALVSYFGRLNYAYKTRYLAEINLRADGSSRFSPNYRQGTFPSFSAAWRVSEEAFFETFKNYVNNLKIRASWGQLGNTTSGYYDWQATYAKAHYAFNNTIFDGMAINKIANERLQWESVTSKGIGIDASFLNSRLNLEFDVYDKLTKGILTSPAIYLTMGMASPPTKNTSDMLNRGFEITAGWYDKIGELRYSVVGNFAYNQNKIVHYLGRLEQGWVETNGVRTYESNIGQVSTAGAETGSLRVENHLFDEFYLRTHYSGTGTYNNNGTVDPHGGPKDGMIRTEADLNWVRDMIAAGYSFNGASVNQNGGLWYGEYLYADLNDDGNYGNNYDRRFDGKSASPKYIYGFSASAQWKGFDFGMTWAGAAGFWYYLRERGANINHLETRTNILPSDARNMFYYLAYDRETAAPLWDDPANNLTAKYARLRSGGAGPFVANEQFLYKASYLKLKTVQIGYTLPKIWTDRAYMDRMRIFVSGENLLTITDYIGVDPEQGSGLNVYPLTRQISLGVNISF